MICQTGPRTTYSGSHTQSIKNRNKYDQVPFLRRVHFGVSVWFLTLQKGYWIFAASLGAWFGWYWPKLRHAWRGPFSSRVYPPSPPPLSSRSTFFLDLAASRSLLLTFSVFGVRVTLDFSPSRTTSHLIFSQIYPPLPSLSRVKIYEQALICREVYYIRAGCDCESIY